jgi:amino acid transporter
VFVRFSRVIALAMAGVVCFGVIVPLALRRHDTALAYGIGALFLVYAVVNVVLWLRYQR